MAGRAATRPATAGSDGVAAAREVWTGCPHCFADVHDGPCPRPLTAARRLVKVIEGIPDADLAAYELRAEAAMVQALQQVMDTIADRIGRVQTAASLVHEFWDDGCRFCLNPKHPGPCAKPHTDPDTGGGHGGGGEAAAGSPAAMHEEEQLRAAYTFTDPDTGYRSEVTGIHRAGDPNPDINERLGGKPTVPAGRTMVTVRVTDSSGNQIGEAVRTIHPASQARVNHNSLVLREGYRGQGFATRFNAHAEDTYRTNGIKEITLHADIDVGGYAWARAGYDFRNNRTRSATVAKAYVESIKRHDSDAVISQFRQHHLSGKATPLDLAMVGHTPGAKTWPGKEIMLESDWQGVKRL